MKKSKLKIFIVLFLTFAIVGTTIILIYYFRNKIELTSLANDNLDNQIDNVDEGVYEEKINIYSGNTRPIAVSIDNERAAWPHSGLQDAYMIYEMIIEGGETRLLAFFQNKDTSKVGPIRSTRHYFVHYVMEHNAIFAHFGWSPKAEEYIKKYNVNNINGIYDSYFWRVGYGYHNAFSSMENIREFATKKNYLQVTSSDKPLYNYSAKSVELKNATDVNNIYIKYSNLHNTSYTYNATDKVYYRYMRGVADKDRETGNHYYAKNIVIMYVNNYNLPDTETKGRQELENIGTGTGYYLTEGKCIEITWSKASDKSKTYFKDLEGNEITLNDGITYVQLVPKDYPVTLN